VASATGIPLGKLAAFERDRAELNAPELASVLSLYKQKLAALRIEEPDVFTFLGSPQDTLGDDVTVQEVSQL